MKKTFEKKILSVIVTATMIIGSNITAYAASETEVSFHVDDVKTVISTEKESASVEIVMDDCIIREVRNNDEIIAKYKYEDGKLVSKYEKGKTTIYSFDDDNNINKIIIDVGLKTYNYSYFYKKENGIKLIEGFVYNEKEYYFIRNSNNYIESIKNDNGDIILEYVYNGQILTDIISYGKEESTVAVLNPICAEGFIYDNVSNMFYVNGRFYNPIKNRFVDGNDNLNIYSETNPYANSRLRSWEYNELYAEEWKNELLQSSSYGTPISYSSGWYNSLSTVEILARLIYGENTSYLNDQKAVGRVILNRLYAGGYGGSLRGIATYPNAFEPITGGSNNTYYARNPITNSTAWENATFIACFICTTTSENEWNIVVGNPSGIDNQLYFVGFEYANNNSKFRDYGQPQYNMDGIWRNIGDIAIAGVGQLSSASDIYRNGWNGVNVFFNIIN